MRAYIDNVVSTVATVFEGLAVTFSHFFRKPYTVQYPDRMPMRVQDTLPYRYRGFLEVDLEICTGCLACERACPIDCIYIETKKDKDTKQLVLERFDIDLAKCMYCGLCSEPCPTGSIHHTREFEGADYSLESMVKRFVHEPVAAYKPKKSGEDDPVILPILERGLRYVGEFAEPLAPPKVVKPAAPAAAAKPAATATEPATAKPAATTPQAATARPAAATPEAAAAKPAAPAKAAAPASATTTEPEGEA
jgi:NADH-quinone oxidoreductase subunit I